MVGVNGPEVSSLLTCKNMRSKTRVSDLSLVFTHFLIPFFMYVWKAVYAVKMILFPQKSRNNFKLPYVEISSLSNGIQLIKKGIQKDSNNRFLLLLNKFFDNTTAMLAKLYNMKWKVLSWEALGNQFFQHLFPKLALVMRYLIIKLTWCKMMFLFLNKFVYFVRMVFCLVKKHFAGRFAFFCAWD